VSTALALTLVLVVLVAVNLWVHLGPRRIHAVTGPLAAAALVLVGRAAGLSWDEMGLAPADLRAGLVWGGLSAAAMAALYGVGIAVPRTRRFFRDTRYQAGLLPMVATALFLIPFGTVMFEEVAFRGVLFGLLLDSGGVPLAAAASSVVFGLWHVLPALDMARTNTAVRSQVGGAKQLLLTVAGTVLFTSLAGLLFSALRWASGSLVAPAVLHWAANGLGVLASALVWSISRGQEEGVTRRTAAPAPSPGASPPPPRRPAGRGWRRGRTRR
jgi:membrane protease YdiL (CAAX protease family)